MGMFDDLIAEHGAPSAQPKAAGMFDDLIAAEGKKAPAPEKLSTLQDVGRAIESGADRGIAALIGMPADIARGSAWAADHIDAWGSGRSYDAVKTERDARALVKPETLEKFGGEAIYNSQSAAKHEPQTTAGRYAQTAAEFGVQAAIMPGRSLASVAKYGLAPGLASEGAGQATQGTSLEPWARAGTALGVTGLAGVASAPAYWERLAARSAHGATPAQFDQAAALARDAQFPVMATEAIQQATGGATQAGRVQRLVESTEGGAQVLDPIMAQRPGQMRAATDTALDTVAPRNAYPSQLGLDVRDAARGAVYATPEGRALDGAMGAAGPRTTAGMAGAVIQPELRATRDGRETVRQLQADRDYRIARDAPENVGVERMIAVERPGDPVVTQPAYSRPQFEPDAPRPVEAFDRPGANGAEPGPESLARFVARNGGLRLDGDAAATDLHRFTIPGVGNVARPDGKSLDNFWRERLIEEGYFRPDADGGMARDISSELLRKLQNEQRGVPSYPLDAQGRPRGRAPGGQAADEYAASRSLMESRLSEDLTRAGIDPAGVHPDIRDRSVGALMRGEISDPLDAYERVVSRMRGPLDPYVKSTTVTEQIPDVRFGQVNPQPAIDAIDDLQRTAKGDVSGALGGVRRNLHGPDGQTDMTVAGNLRARERLDQEIRAAQEIGDGTKVRDLTITRDAIDAELKRVPQVATADANFAANSVPLEPFSGQNPLGRITARDDLTGRMQMPAEQAPTTLSTPAAAREFGTVARPGGRAAFDNYLTTHMLDGAPGDFRVSPDRLRSGMQDKADLLAEAPTVRDRLSRILAAREGLAPVEAAPIGRMASTDAPREQLATLLSKGASPVETGDTVRALAAQNGPAARGLVREGAGQVADRTVAGRDSLSRPDQYGGAKFAREFRSAGAGDNLRAAIEAAAGPASSAEIDRLVRSLEATGWRERIGSRTAFNAEDIASLKGGGMLGNAVQLASKPFGTVHDAVSKYRLGRSAENLAQLIASGEVGVRRIQELQAAGARGKIVAALAGQRTGTELAAPRRRDQ